MKEAIETQISIKGIRDGLLISLGNGSYEDRLAALQEELKDSKGFLRGSRIALEVGERRLDVEQLAYLQEEMARHGLAMWAVLAQSKETQEAARQLGLATRLPGSNVDLDGRQLAERPVVEPIQPAQKAEPDGSNSLLLRETVRSGRSVYHEGHVIIIGDVNPGAEIISGGDVVVWGRLRGLVHAGAHGDSSAVICALELIPTQLRIAGQIAIAPREQQRQAIPEKALIQDGQIVAETWNKKA